jgi:tRNA (mo5U34)-methyltransferase
MNDQLIRDRIASVAHWYHQIEVRPGIVTPGINDSATTLARLDLPERCDGLRALDIGVRDGFFSFELERRGAEVVAIDYMDPAETGFGVARELVGSSVEYVVDNVYNVTPERYGTFDIVLFLGVMYHLRDPLLVLDRLWDVSNPDATLALETQILDSAVLLPDGSFTALPQIDPRLPELCLMQFHPGDSLHGDHTNYWSPNAACTRGLMEAAGFAVTGEAILGKRGIFVGRRVVDSTQVYHRRIEKATVAEGSAPYAPPAPGPAAAPGKAVTGAPAGAAPADGRAQALQVELSAVRREQLALESELAAARLENGDLRRALAQAAGDDGPVPATPAAGLRDRLGALRRRAR